MQGGRADQWLTDWLIDRTVKENEKIIVVNVVELCKVRVQVQHSKYSK